MRDKLLQKANFLKTFAALQSFWISKILLAKQHFDHNASPDYYFGLDAPMNTFAGKTDWGQVSNHVYLITTIVLVLIFVAVSIPYFYSIYKFRVSEEDAARLPPPKQVHGSQLLEITWTIIPIIMLIFVAIPTWQGIFRRHHMSADDAIVIEVIGHQWWWEFYYPALNIRTASELHVPANTKVMFKLTSRDVIHSFWIAQWGGKVDTIPGRWNDLLLTTPMLNDENNKGGEYYQGQCAELCGLSHALMRFEAVVHSKKEFEDWVGVYNNPPKVGTTLEKKGEEVFNKCMSCHTISGTPSEDIEKHMLAGSPPTYKLGPNLSNFGNRRTLAAGTRKNTEENFIEWVSGPDSLKPGSKMQNLGLSEDELHAVAAYLRYSTYKDYHQDDKTE